MFVYNRFGKRPHHKCYIHFGFQLIGGFPITGLDLQNGKNAPQDIFGVIYV